MIYLAVGAIFKNESHILKEWLDHHIYHGVQKFYLLNDNSTDNFMSILQPYTDNNIVSLYNLNHPIYDERQVDIYNKYFYPILISKQVQWLAIIDLDEFLYSPETIDIKSILSNFHDIAQIHVNWVMFGSNGHIEQPNNVVQNFTRRAKYDTNNPVPKCILNSNFYFNSLGIHFCLTPHQTKNVSLKNDKALLLINHYYYQSYNFWTNIKMTRGDVNCYLANAVKDLSNFARHDNNDEEDLILANQNKNINNLVITNNNYNLELPNIYSEQELIADLLSRIVFNNNNYDCVNDYDYLQSLGWQNSKNQPSIWFTDQNKISIFKNNYKNESDPQLIIVTMNNNKLSTFLDIVQHLLNNKYTPIQMCNKNIIAIYSKFAYYLNYKIGYKNTDFLHLYINIYYDGGWKYDSSMYEDMYKRNYFIKHGIFSDSIDYDNINKNQSLIWKPLF